jgi:hypothetical protein
MVDDADVPVLRDAVARIARTGFSEEKVLERLGLDDLADLQMVALPIYRAERLFRRDALSSAIDLLLLQGALPADAVDAFTDAAGRDVLLRTGLLIKDDNGRVRAGASLYPVGGRLIFSDHAWPGLPHPGLARVPHDQVMFVGVDSRWLARVTSRRQVESALDLCTGSGIHALLAAGHARRVIAVDKNPRAAQCAQFNARALGLENVRVEVGDLFAPVQGGRFDLITANPPFVPSPVDAIGYRDGGRSGEDVQRRIIEGLPEYLAKGGVAQIVTEMGERDDAPLAERLRQWLGGAPLDIHVLRLRVHNAATYAYGHADGVDAGALLESVGAWADNLRTQGFTRVVSVLLAFQWSDPKCGAPWTRIEQARPPRRDAGMEVEAAFFAERQAHTPDLNDVIAQSRLCRAGPVALQDARMLGGGVAIRSQATLLGRAIGMDHSLDPVEREILVRLEEPIAGSDLAGIALELGHDERAVFSAVASLLRRELVRMTPSAP